MLLVITALAATPAHALLGDTLEVLSKRRGKPIVQPAPNRAAWLFEGLDGPLLYSVTFGADGRSMAEGLKPARPRDSMHPDFVADFIKSQREVLAGSTTTRELAETGLPYTFAGRKFVLGKDEYVVIDEPRGVLIIYTRGALPSVIVLTPAAMP